MFANGLQRLTNHRNTRTEKRRFNTMRIAFLGNLPPASVLPEEFLRPRLRRDDHPAPWITSLLPNLARISGFKLRFVIVDYSIRRHALVERDGVEYEGIPCRLPERLNRKTLYFQKSLAATPVLRRFKPDLVHAFGFETGFGTIALRSAFPVSCFIQGIAEDYFPYYKQRDWIERRVGRWAERRAVRQVKWMVAETEYARTWALRHHPAADVALIPHSLRSVFHERAEPLYGNSILTLGTLEERKGMDTILKAFAKTRCADARLVMVGDGALRASLESLADHLGIRNRVDFTGALDTREVIERMNHARVCVIASRADTSPNVVTEAHAIGLPVIGTRVGGIPEMIHEGEDGYLVERDDASAMAERMTRLLMDESLARRLGQAGQAKVRRLNDPTKIAEIHARFFERIGNQLGVYGI